MNTSPLISPISKREGLRFWRTRAIRFGILLGMVSVLLLFSPSPAGATHFRGGTIDYTINSSGLLRVEMTTLWRDAFVGDAFVDLWSGNRSVIVKAFSNFTVVSDTVVNPAGRDLIGYYARRTSVFTLNLPANSVGSGTYLLRFESCCRVDAIWNVGQSSFSLESKMPYTAGIANGSPTMIPATIDIVARGHLYTQSLLSQDPDRGLLNYVLLNGDASPDWGPATQIPGIGIDSDGVISIPASNTATLSLGRWVYKVRVTDTSGAYSERDILIIVQDPTAGNTAPVLGPLTTPQGAYPIGTVISFPLTGTDNDTDAQNVTVRSGPLPWASTMPQVTVNTPGTASSSFNWTPAPGDEGVYRIYFETYDQKPSDELFTPYIDSKVVQITVASHQPPSINPVDNRCVAVGSPVSFTVTANDPDGTLTTIQANFLPAGATFPTVTGTATVTGTFNWTPSAGQYGQWNIAFSATDAGSPPLSVSTGTTINVTSSPVQSNVYPSSVACGVPTILTCQPSAGTLPYTVSWQARPDPSSPWETFEVDSVSSAPTTTTTVHQAGISFPQTGTTQYRAVTRDSSNCQVGSILVAVTGSGSPPSFSSQPQPASVCFNQTAVFSVSGTAAAYQWQRSTNGGATWVNVTGATAATYTTPPVTASAVYRCVIWSGCNSLTSNSARLTVTPLPASPGNSLRGTKVSATWGSFSWSSCADASSYRLLRCAVTTGPCTPTFLQSVGINQADDSAAAGAAYWYLVESANACGNVP